MGSFVSKEQTRSLQNISELRGSKKQGPSSFKKMVSLRGQKGKVSMRKADTLMKKSKIKQDKKTKEKEMSSRDFAKFVETKKTDEIDELILSQITPKNKQEAINQGRRNKEYEESLFESINHYRKFNKLEAVKKSDKCKVKMEQICLLNLKKDRFDFTLLKKYYKEFVKDGMLVYNTLYINKTTKYLDNPDDFESYVMSKWTNEANMDGKIKCATATHANVAVYEDDKGFCIFITWFGEKDDKLGYQKLED